MKAPGAVRPYAGGVHVVVVDDERRMVELVTGYLEELGIRTTGCHDGHEALVAARGEDVDVMVLDLMLPGVSGLDVCRRLRREGNDVPILMLTARGAVPERVAGLEAGADDYLVKPFALEELVARLRAIGRRREQPEHRLTAGDVVLDPLEQRVRVADVEVPLSRREFAMLQVLMENAGRGRPAAAAVRRGLGRRGGHPQQLHRRAHVPAAGPPRGLGVGARHDPARRGLPAGDRPAMSLWQRLVGDRPIVTRLVVAVAAAMAVVLVVAAAFVYWRVSFALDRQLDQDLDAYRQVVERSLRTGVRPPGDTPGETFQVYDGQGRVVAGNRRLAPLLDTDDVAAARRGPTRLDVGRFLPPTDRAYRVLAATVPTPQGSRVVATAISRRKHDEALRELLLQLAIADLMALVAASYVGYRTARAALDPVERYRRAAQDVGQDDTGRRLPVAAGRDDELSRLGHTFNDAARPDRGELPRASGSSWPTPPTSCARPCR